LWKGEKRGRPKNFGRWGGGVTGEKRRLTLTNNKTFEGRDGSHNGESDLKVR